MFRGSEYPDRLIETNMKPIDSRPNILLPNKLTIFIAVNIKEDFVSELMSQTLSKPILTIRTID